ncbi:glycosyltransferase family 4 protein [Alienimonas californiensis]|uniref:Glycosyl transferases group 1 n=1 Tax=Alienimonas californiensis TaxID=2527989 RepID=A0A517P7Y5_9PLAN|nr:glycosyltransferase family 4 protein [Alienimonas californiensis]QDT15490.1 hypothetical protein CA12_15750 [Alienimonas californiensis]
MSSPRIDLFFPLLPPAPDGIGDYTAQLAAALSAVDEAAGDGGTIGVLTGSNPADPIPGVEIVPCENLLRGGLAAAVGRRRPDWLVVQYNPFSYGRRGFAPRLPLALRACRRASPGTRVAVMVHELFVPFADAKTAAMSLWQRPQFAAVTALADVTFFSIEAWTARFRRRHPRRRAVHLPVGSNLPQVAGGAADQAVLREALRAGWNLGPNVPVLGLFGSAHASRLLPLVDAAAAAARERSPEAALLYVGPHGAAVRAALGGRVIDAGRLPAAEAARQFAAMDLALAPFVDGVSTRRGSMIAGLQQGVATVGTRAFLTDGLLRDADGTALRLTPPEPAPFAAAVGELLDDPARRAVIAAGGRALYDAQFAWPAIADRLRAALRA